jgi:hypothetical protein
MSAAATEPQRSRTEGITEMATTKQFLVIQTTSGARGNGKGIRQFDLKAKVAMGVAVLGCAAALAFGGLHAVDPAQGQPAASAATTQAPAGGMSTPPMQLPNNSYADLIWELENSAPAASVPQQSGQLSGGSYADLIWELEHPTR